MAEEGGFDEGADHGLFVGVELVDGFEVVAGGLWGRSLSSLARESMLVVEVVGDAAQDVEGGLAGAGFVAAELGDVDAGGVGEGLLGESAWLCGCRVRLSGKATC